MEFALFDTLVHIRYEIETTITNTSQVSAVDPNLSQQLSETPQKILKKKHAKLIIAFEKDFSSYKAPADIASFCYPEQRGPSPLKCPQPFEINQYFFLVIYLLFVLEFIFLFVLQQIPISIGTDSAFVFLRIQKSHPNAYALLLHTTGLDQCKNF